MPGVIIFNAPGAEFLVDAARRGAAEESSIRMNKSRPVAAQNANVNDINTSARVRASAREQLCTDGYTLLRNG